ncbi:MAG: hypothetical protein V4635_06255 [Bacteroidota bacterium]
MKEKEELYNEMYLSAIRLLRQGESHLAIEEYLLRESDDIVLITVAITEAKKTHYAALRKQGFRLMVVGCITGLSGFLITCINFNTSRPIDFAMYGLTSVGITTVCWGLFKIIG